jgi:formate/nitrite transporter FocA (FNT family)
MKSKIQSILAGILIGIGAYAYVSISNLYIGAFIFSLGLISVFILEAKLFTGKIGNLNKTN